MINKIILEMTRAEAHSLKIILETALDSFDFDGELSLYGRNIEKILHRIDQEFEQ